MRRDAYGAHAGAASSVRNCERLVEIEMADVRADRGGTRQADLRVHVRAVHIDLAAIDVDDRTDVLNALFEDAVGRGIGHH